MSRLKTFVSVIPLLARLACRLCCIATQRRQTSNGLTTSHRSSLSISRSTAHSLRSHPPLTLRTLMSCFSSRAACSHKTRKAEWSIMLPVWCCNTGWLDLLLGQSSTLSMPAGELITTQRLIQSQARALSLSLPLHLRLASHQGSMRCVSTAQPARQQTRRPVTAMR